MTLLRIWLVASAAIVTAIAIWAFAPILVAVLLLVAALGLLSALMISFARTLQAWRQARFGAAKSTREDEAPPA